MLLVLKISVPYRPMVKSWEHTRNGKKYVIHKIILKKKNLLNEKLTFPSFLSMLTPDKPWFCAGGGRPGGSRHGD